MRHRLALLFVVPPLCALVALNLGEDRKPKLAAAELHHEKPLEDVESQAPAASGMFSTLTYNVAGLPEVVSDSHPLENTPQMSPLLNAFDVVLIQEDFYYHPALIGEATHEFKSEPLVASPTIMSLGDGLSNLSHYDMSQFTRHFWRVCHGLHESGWDCFTTKGFTYSRLELGASADDEIAIDVYNVHLDAGLEYGDIAAREANVTQLLKILDANSDGAAVIIAGDLNLDMKIERDRRGLERLLDGAQLDDACATLNCGSDRLDRILYRSSTHVTLEAVAYDTPEAFRRPTGEPLSDHLPVSVDFRWSVAER